MKTTDGRNNDILDKQGVETDAKDREETLKDTPVSKNSIEQSQQTLFLREDENKQQDKITVQTIEEAMTTNEERTPVSVWCGYEKCMILLRTTHFWRFGHVVTSLYSCLILPSNFSPPRGLLC